MDFGLSLMDFEWLFDGFWIGFDGFWLAFDGFQMEIDGFWMDFGWILNGCLMFLMDLDGFGQILDGF